MSSTDLLPVADWAAGGQALAVLRAAHDAGVLAALHAPRTVAQLAGATGRDAAWLDALCAALVAHDVAARRGDAYELTAAGARLADPDATQPLGNLLAGVAARARQVELSGAGGDYTALSGAEQVALAVGTGASPLTAAGRAMFAGMARSVPEIWERWEHGGTHLEVGCGAGNALLSFAAEFPQLRVEGLELNADVLAEARRRAELLGVADRVRLRHMDARDLDDVERFDSAQWSQLFFGEATRAAVLRALHRALKPGAPVVLPTLDEEAPDARGGAVRRLLVTGWGVPVRTRAQLRSELEDAGFEVLVQAPLSANAMTTSDGFALARRRP